MQDIYSLKIFDGIDRKILNSIIENLKTENFSIWSAILLEWEDSNGKAYIIKSWEVSIEISWTQRAILKTWDIFWEIALLNEEQRTATVKALTDVQVLILTQDSIFELINNWNDSINRDIMDRIEQNLNNN